MICSSTLSTRQMRPARDEYSRFGSNSQTPKSRRRKFRHYGPMAQDFFAAFGHDAVGQIGSETTINTGDQAGILMIAVQALEKRTTKLKQKEAQIAALESKVEDLKAKHAYFEALAARLEALELRKNQSIQITAEKSLGDKVVEAMP
jgi:hypothetical protein